MARRYRVVETPCRAGCGNQRRPGNIFCRDCYLRLPIPLRIGLWSHDFTVLRGSILAALKWLDDHEEDT